MIGKIFHFIFYQPLYNALVFLVGIVPFNDIGIAIIVLTAIVWLILFPFTHRSAIARRKMKEIEPEIRKIKEKFKDNSQEQAKRTMALYRQHGVSPFSGFFMILIQFPVLFAIYRLFSGGLKFNSANLYFFVSLPLFFRIEFLGLIDLSQKSYVLAGLAAITQFFQIRLSLPDIKKTDGNSMGSSFARSMNIQFRYIMPVFIFFIALKFSSALALYWTAMNVFAILHEAIVAHKAKKASEKTNGTAIRNHQINN